MNKIYNIYSDLICHGDIIIDKKLNYNSLKPLQGYYQQPFYQTITGSFNAKDPKYYTSFAKQFDVKLGNDLYYVDVRCQIECKNHRYHIYDHMIVGSGLDYHEKTVQLIVTTQDNMPVFNNNPSINMQPYRITILLTPNKCRVGCTFYDGEREPTEQNKQFYPESLWINLRFQKIANLLEGTKIIYENSNSNPN